MYVQERTTCGILYMYIYVYIHTLYIYIYIYICVCIYKMYECITVFRAKHDPLKTRRIFLQIIYRTYEESN